MASIKCGKCSGTHESVAQVRRCYAANGKAPANSVRSNRYAADCADCGGRVEANEGRLDSNSGSWQVRHADPSLCKPVEVKKSYTSPAPEAQAPKAAERLDFSDVPGGYYATANTRGTNDLDFWYVKEGRRPGFRFVKRVIGGQGPQHISRTESIRALYAIREAGVQKAGELFADELGRCWKCGLPLTDEESRARRMGPVCAAK